MPALSVLLPVHNALPWLGPSLRSLWRQSLADFEVVAVDDGSTDGSGEALERAARHEPRLRVLRGPHRGLPTALNEALARARAPVVARHDADDLSHRRRFELQLDTLRRRSEVAVVGCRLRMFPAPAVGAGMRRWASWHNSLLEHDDIAGEMLIDSPLAHGTAMTTRAWLERVGGWRERGWPEDLDLWIRLLRAGARFTKRPEVLYGWRQHRASATRRDPRYRRERFIELKLDALEHGLLHRARHMTIVGVGESLARCVPVFEAARHVRVVESGRPARRTIEAVAPPIVLVFMSPVARARWRAALAAAGYEELRHFVFIA
jgi:glycosyltransferase involved in cell wall biosynthesis